MSTGEDYTSVVSDNGEYSVYIHNIRKYPVQDSLDDLYNVGRPSILGNPFTMSQEEDRANVIERYKTWLDLQWINNNPEVRNELIKLAKILKEAHTIDLGCWCAPKPCHADVIAKALINILNQKIV